MNEFDIDNAIDTSFLDDSSIDSFESSEDALNVMDSVEIPAIEDTAIENGNIENIDLEDNLCEDTEMLNSEVNDIMDDAEVEELVFEDDQVENTLESESLESTIDQPVEEVTPDLSEMLDNVEAMPVVFDEELEEAEQVEEPYEAVENSEIEILQEDGIVDTLENIQEQLEKEPEEAEQVEEPYEAVENSEIEILQEDGIVDTLENIQEQLEKEPEEAEQVEEPYEAVENSEIEILQEDGIVDTLENIQEQLEKEPEEAEQVEEPYEAVENSEIEILQEDGIVDTLESNQEQLDPHEALNNMSEYMNAHNYGLDDYGTYSKDPEWQALNRDLQVANGIEPTEYTEELSDSIETQEQLDPHEALNNMSEYMNAHNYGLDDYGTYSKDPEWQALNRDLQVANGIEPSGQVIEGLQEISPDVTLREFDDFEQSVLEYRPAFYETGSYYEQGVNEFGYQGTCGPTSQANAINQLLGTNELTENKVLSVAIDNNLCETHGALDCCGGTTTEQFMELYNKMNEQLGDKFETELFEYNNVLDANQVAERLENGDVINVAVDADTLWDQPRSYTNEIGARQGDSYSNHWITVTGVERMEDGEIKGFDIIDSGAGESYVSLDKYNDMCFGTDEHRVIDPTCIVLSRKNEGEQISLEDGLEDIHSFPENNADIAESKKPTIFDWIFHRKGE